MLFFFFSKKNEAILQAMLKCQEEPPQKWVKWFWDQGKTTKIAHTPLSGEFPTRLEALGKMLIFVGWYREWNVTVASSENYNESYRRFTNIQFCAQVFFFFRYLSHFFKKREALDVPLDPAVLSEVRRRVDEVTWIWGMSYLTISILMEMWYGIVPANKPAENLISRFFNLDSEGTLKES